MLISHCHRGIFLEISIIQDLPCKNSQDVKNNYAKIADLKEAIPLKNVQF
jgi:hypothetical protein